MAGQKIIEGLKDAIAGNIRRVHIDGQCWERVNRTLDDPPAEQEVEHLAAQCADLLRENERLAAEIERLRAAIRWALGEAPDGDGNWFSNLDNEEGPHPPYWWRKNLRKIAGMGDLRYDKERRTIVSGDEQ